MGFKAGAKIGRWGKKLKNSNPALKQIGILMVAESQESLTKQKHGRKRWDARAPVNVYGIIADFAAGKAVPPKRRFQRRPVLKDTGRLQKSIAYRLVSGNAVEIGTNLKYAAVHQFGGPIESEKLTDKVLNALSSWLEDEGEKYQKLLGPLLNEKLKGTTLKGKVEARPFLGITKQTIKDVREVVKVTIMEIK